MTENELQELREWAKELAHPAETSGNNRLAQLIGQAVAEIASLEKHQASSLIRQGELADLSAGYRNELDAWKKVVRQGVPYLLSQYPQPCEESPLLPLWRLIYEETR